MGDRAKLRALKLLHTAVWVFFAGCVLGMPVMTAAGRFGAALAMAGAVLAEGLVVALNGWRCPITPVAGRYTTDRRANFDIYLPEWLARHNIRIFGWLYAAGLVYLAARLLAAPAAP